MSHHVIHYYGPISLASTNQFKDVLLSAVTQKGASKVSILLSSDGGNLNCGFATYNLIRSLPIPVCMYNMGTVESIAAIIYLAADERFALKHSRFLFHSLNWGYPQGSIDHSRLVEHSISLNYDLERYVEIFNARTEGAQSAIDIRECLNGQARILGPATGSGIVTAKIPDEWTMPIVDTIHWWVNSF